MTECVFFNELNECLFPIYFTLILVTNFLNCTTVVCRTTKGKGNLTNCMNNNEKIRNTGFLWSRGNSGLASEFVLNHGSLYIITGSV